MEKHWFRSNSNGDDVISVKESLIRLHFLVFEARSLRLRTPSQRIIEIMIGLLSAQGPDFIKNLDWKEQILILLPLMDFHVFFQDQNSLSPRQLSQIANCFLSSDDPIIRNFAGNISGDVFFAVIAEIVSVGSNCDNVNFGIRKNRVYFRIFVRIP